MGFEYIRLSRPELSYGKKEILQLELEVLLMAKKFKELCKLRKEKLALKSELLKKLTSAKKIIENLNSQLPKTKKQEENKETKTKKPAETLDNQIDEIKKKLIVLQQTV